MARRSGWYRPTGGGVMYGPLPDGAVEVPEPGSAPAPVIPIEGLDRLSKVALVETAGALRLPTDGTKADLIERITSALSDEPVEVGDSDAEQGSAALVDEDAPQADEVDGPVSAGDDLDPDSVHGD